MPNLSGDHLVTSVETNPGDGLPITKETYQYNDSKVHIGNNDEMGLLGFKSTTKETSVITPQGEEKKVSTQVTEYNQADPIELGKPSRVKTYNATGKLQDEVSIQYEKVTTPNGTLTHRVKSQNDTIYENGNYFSQNTISYEYDTNGNVTKETTNIEGNITEVIKSYSPLNQVSTYTKKSNGVVIDNRVYTYTGANLSSSSVEIQPGKWATTNFEHDDKGNITSVTNPVGQATTITYNSNSQATEATNHLGHTISYKYDSKTGQITKKTDPNGGVSEIEFDDYGRITLVKNPGESNWSKKIIYSNSPNNTYVEERERIVDASEGVSIFPLPLIGSSETYTWTRSYFDNEGKIRKKETSGKDGKVYTEDFVYDYLGRLISQSEPYIAGQTPKFTNLEYDNSEGRLTKVVKPDGKEITYSYNRFTVTKTSTNKPTEIATSNALGQVLSQTIGDLTTSYAYNESGRVSAITEPSGNKVSLDYDRSGNILTKIDSNTGKITYTYNLIGNLTSSTDARGVTIKYTYYQDGRMHKYSANGEEVEYFYDENQTNAKGKVTKIKDSTGEVKLEYDKRGNVVKRTHLIENYEIKFEYAHDSMNRVRQIIYPDGTIVSYIYNDKELETIKMLPNDGRSKELKMLGFQYNEIQNKLTKTFGNGVVTEYVFDQLSGYLTSYKLTTGMTKRVEEHKKYFYDNSGNMTTINDLANPWKSQTFSFDTYNRLTKSKGSYGEKKYTYTTNGNLTEKGDITMQYTDTDHANAVTSVRIPNPISSVTDTYDYDAAGYIHKRNNDTFTHDGLGRLSSIVTGFGEEFNYFYDYRGMRKKKINRLKNETTYYFEDGLYEIHVAPSVSQRYTLYVKNDNELIAQWTRTDAVLTQNKSGFIPSVNLENQQYLFAFLFLLFLSTLLIQQTQTNLRLSVFICGNIFALSLALITCTKSKDNFPFFAFTSFIGTDTPSVNDAQSDNDGGGGGSANAPIEGLYFFHTDHLDSVTMLTNTSGEVIAGTTLGSGKSIISYTPYGEIDRDHSSGPDIFRYKYTGQEEDKETGLYYYKARYYDPKIGRFLQPDTVLQTSSPFGTNQYMYVDGNPVMYNDPSGHKSQNFMKKWLSNLRTDFKKWRRNTGNDFSNAIGRRRHGGNLWAKNRRWGVDRLRRTLMDFSGYVLMAADIYLGDFMGLNLLQRKPLSYIKFEHGGIGVHNSFFANNYDGGRSFVPWGKVAFLETGASRQIILHEFGHVKQNKGGYFRKPFRNGWFAHTAWTEFECDWKAGTANYEGSMFIINQVFGEYVANAAMLYNNYLVGRQDIPIQFLYNKMIDSGTDASAREFLLFIFFNNDLSDEGRK
ncbi:MAG: RHS repeat-associated core domain-containing protein [Leptospiraceae bacterium]|nr:RHS repeat-associated core domain-containing protein [Leptospiraceae bacterium]